MTDEEFLKAVGEIERATAFANDKRYMDEMTDKLKPCPFCNGSAQIERKGTARASMQIGCENCGAFVESGDVVGLTDPRSYRWNVRESDAEIEYLRKELTQWNDLKVALGAKDSTAFFDALCNRDKEITRLRKLVTELEAWKESALTVMPDFQEIGRLMGLPLGASVSPEIVPWMAETKKRMKEITAMMDEAIAVFDRYLNVPESVALRKRWESFKNQTL